MTTHPPSGTVTFLFTDIEGSMRLLEDATEEMRDVVAEHDARFRAAIEANDGYVVKGRGDGVHAAFSRAGDAVNAPVGADSHQPDWEAYRLRATVRRCGGC